MFSGSKQFKSMYSPLTIAEVTLLVTWVARGGVAWLSGTGRTGGGGEELAGGINAMASCMDDVISDLMVVSWSGVKGEALVDGVCS